MIKNFKISLPLSILVVAVLWAAYHSIVQMRSYWLNDTIDYRLGQAWGKQGSFDEFDSIRDLIRRNEALSRANPRTCSLAGNTYMRWVLNGMPESTEALQDALNSAEQYYVKALNLQPDNPFNWLNLANVLQQNSAKKQLFEFSLAQAEKYGRTQPAVIQTLSKLK